MRLLIFEPRVSGHHAQYLKFILRAAKQLTDDVSLVTRSDIYAQPEYNVHLKGELSSVKVLNTEFSNGRTGLRQDVYHYKLLKTSIADQNPDLVWVPYVDRLAQIAGLMSLFGSKFSKRSDVIIVGLIFRGAAAYSLNTKLGSYKDKLSLKLASMAPITQLYTVDNLLHEYFRQLDVGHCHLMPEPVENPEDNFNSADTLKSIGIPSSLDTKVIASLGAQNSRKGVDLLVRAFFNSNLRESDYLLLGGSVDDSLLGLIDRYKADPKFKQLVVLNRLLTVQEIQRYLHCADFVVVPYPEHIGSSSFVLRAAKGQKPLIASKTGWIGFTAAKYSLGFICDVRNQDEFSDAIRCAYQGEPESFEFKPNYKALNEYHTIENFIRCWVDTAAKTG